MIENEQAREKIEALENTVKFLTLELERLQSAEAALRENEEKFRLIFDNSADAIYLADTETGIITNCNRAGEALIERPRSEIIGKHQSILHPADRYEEFSAMFRKHIELRGAVDEEAEVITSSGQRKDVHIRAAVTEAGGKKIIQGIFRNITERKKSEREKEILSQQLLHAQKMESIGSLAGGIAHDFNNILATISGMAEVIKRTEDPGSKTYERIEKMLKSIGRAKDLTMKLLTFARREKVESAVVNLKDVIGEALDMIKAVASKNIVINVSGSGDCGRVSADMSQLVQGFMNIYINACDAMPDGGLLTVNIGREELGWDFCSYRAHMSPGRYCRVDITDTGSGIDPEILPRIFDPFFTTKEKGKGTGLGLSITIGIIQAHGGDVLVKSASGLGTTVSIFLPEISEETKGVDGVVRDVGENLKGIKVLAIDDEVDFLEVLELVLKMYNAEIMTAHSSSIGIEMFREHHSTINAVILDMIMPGKSSLEVFEELKKIDPDCKVIVCSGFSLRGQAREMLKKGAAGFIQKPFLHEELVNAVYKVSKK